MSSSCKMIHQNSQWPHRNKLCIIYSHVELFQTPCMNNGNKWTNEYVCLESTEMHGSMWSHAFLFINTNFQNSSVRMHTLNEMRCESKGWNNAITPGSLDLIHVTHNFQKGRVVFLFSKGLDCLSGPLSLLSDGYIGLFPGSKVAQRWI